MDCLVASSIGLGSGLHTFVLCLGPHIALFTIKAVYCGRIDLKSAPYDTILLKKAIMVREILLDFGPSIYQETIPFNKILQEVYLEAILWGIGTTLGELHPYFLSRVPNPLFDLVGMLCGQYSIPFWKFFLATLIGNTIVKVCIQISLVITLCNNHLLDLVEKRLVWAFGNVPGVASVLPSFVVKLKTSKNKFLSAHVAASASVTAKGKWNLSFSLLWNTLVWLMVINFIIQIVRSTTQGYLRTQQELEISKMLTSSKLSASESSSG